MQEIVERVWVINDSRLASYVSPIQSGARTLALLPLLLDVHLAD